MLERKESISCCWVKAPTGWGLENRVIKETKCGYRDALPWHDCFSSVL